MPVSASIQDQKKLFRVHLFVSDRKTNEIISLCSALPPLDEGKTDGQATCDVFQ